MNRLIALSSALLLCGCNRTPTAVPQADPTPERDRLMAYLRTPQYGEPVEVAGRLTINREEVSLSLCGGGTERCDDRRNVDGSFQPCWAVALPGADRDLTRLARGAKWPRGSYWIKGRGRIAVQPGLFGHVGSYTCQVELQQVSKIVRAEF